VKSVGVHNFSYVSYAQRQHNWSRMRGTNKNALKVAFRMTFLMSF